MRRVRVRGAPPARARGRPARRAARRPPAGARRPACDVAGSRGLVPGAREVRSRPHRARGAGEARPGDRARRGDPPHHPGALAAHEEQPGADRRARRGQDGDRGGPRTADRRGRRARGPQGQARVGARRRRARRRGEVPRRVRGAPQGRPRGDHRERGPDHPLHRRAPYDRRRRRRRGRGLGGEPAEADARTRRAPRRRCDDARRVPHAHREGRRARAPLPARLRGRAVRGRHDRHPPRPQGALRGAPRRPDPRRRARRGGGAVRPLHLRPLPPRQGDRPRRRGGLAPAHGGRLLARRARRGGAPRDAARDRARRDGEGGPRDPRAAREGARRGEGAARRARRTLGEREGRPRPGEGDHAPDRRAAHGSGARGATRQSGPGRGDPVRPASRHSRRS